MRINPRYVQVVGDAAIPLVGFFFWNWTLYFTLLFYLLDFLFNEVFMHVKSARIVKEKKLGLKEWMRYGLASFLLFFGSIVLIHITMQSVETTIDFQKELIKFWNYQDMGIKQGYVLIPLLFFVGYQRYKMEFLATGKFRSLALPSMWFNHFKSQWLILASSGIVLGLSQFVVFQHIIYILGIVFCTSLYQVFRNDN